MNYDSARTFFRFLLRRVTSAALSLCCIISFSGCFQTMPPDRIQRLLDAGYVISWESEVGYWDEFQARKKWRTKKFLVNLKQVTRDPRLEKGDKNVVKLRKDGTIVVTAPPG